MTTTEDFCVVAEDIYGNQRHYAKGLSRQSAEALLNKIKTRPYKHHQVYWVQETSVPLHHALNS